MPKLTKRIVDAAEVRTRQYTIWCSDLKGFGVFVMPSGTKTYFVDYRNASGVRRRMTIGRHGAITADQARKLAISTIGETVKGDDPAEERASRRRSMTVRELCGLYEEAAAKGLILGKGNRSKKASTLYTDHGRIKRHIIPLMGTKKVQDLKAADINRFIRDVASGKTAVSERTRKKRGKSIVRGGLGTASRTVGLLGGILSFAVSEGIIERNPAWGVKRPSDSRRHRRMIDEEYARLGAALRAMAAEGDLEQPLIGAWLLALTGCRLGEISKLKWSEVDRIGRCLRLDDSKEGASIRPIGKAALAVLDRVSKTDDVPFVLRPVRSGESFGGMPRAWARIAKRAELDGVTMHTLRHSFASVAADLGYSEPTIAALLGHAANSITSRYVHHLDAVLLAAADKVSGEIEQIMRGEKRTFGVEFAGAIEAAA